MIDQPLSKIFVKGEFSKRFFDTAAVAVGLLNSFLTITFLSVFHFGLYQLILAFVAIVDGLNVKNLDGPISAEMRHYLNAGEKPKAKRIFYEMAAWRIGFALVMGVIIFFGSNIIAGFYGDDIGFLVKIVSPLPLFLAAHSLVGIFLKSIISFAHWSIPALREFSKLLIILALIIFGQFTITGIVAAHVAAQLFAVFAIVAVVALRKFVGVFRGIGAVKENLIFQFVKTHGKWIFLQFGISRITKNTMPWLIKFFLNTEAVAFYSLAVNLIAMVESLMPIAGISPLFLVKLGDRAQMGFIFQRSAKYVLWLGVIFGVLALVFIPPIVLFLFPKYEPAIPIFLMMLLALPFYGIYKILKSAIASLREHKIMAIRAMREALVIPIGSVIFLPLFGVLGAALVYLATYLERVLTLYSQLVKRYPEFRLKFLSFFRLDAEDKDILKKALKAALKFKFF